MTHAHAQLFSAFYRPGPNIAGGKPGTQLNCGSLDWRLWVLRPSTRAELKLSPRASLKLLTAAWNFFPSVVESESLVRSYEALTLN